LYGGPGENSTLSFDLRVNQRNIAQQEQTRGGLSTENNPPNSVSQRIYSMFLFLINHFYN
jgi:hypothetical protein